MRGQQEFRPIEAFYATETSSTQTPLPRVAREGRGVRSVLRRFEDSDERLVI